LIASSDKNEETSSTSQKNAVSYRRFFIVQTFYLFALTISTCFFLVSDRAGLGSFAAMDDGYNLLLIVECVFGAFILPFALSYTGSVKTGNLGKHVGFFLVFISGAPFIAVSAFASGLAWYGILVTQVLVLGLWTVFRECHRYAMLEDRFRLFYLPACAFLFFGLMAGGQIAAGFSVTWEIFASFSVPNLIFSWSDGNYLSANTWFGAAICFGALVVWLRKSTLKA